LQYFNSANQTAKLSDVKKCFLIRHGQNRFNVRGIVQGQRVDSSAQQADHL
jgi:broad specificity phosphatase PhoE